MKPPRGVELIHFLATENGPEVRQHLEATDQNTDEGARSEMNATNMLAEQAETRKTPVGVTPPASAKEQPVENLDRLNLEAYGILPCNDSSCLWKGGHVEIEAIDIVHVALSAEDAFWSVDVVRGDGGSRWNIVCDTVADRLSSAATRDLASALEAAELLCGALNVAVAATYADGTDDPDTIGVEDWNKDAFWKPNPSGRAHLYLHQEPENDSYEDRIQARPECYLPHLDGQRPGFTWGDDDGEFLFTYLGLFEVAASLSNPETGQSLTNFRRVPNAA